MIGQLLSMRYVGKKKWSMAFFCMVLTWFLSVFVILVYRYAYPKMKWPMAIKVFVIGFVIDIAIVLALWSLLFASYFAYWYNALAPAGSLLGII